MRGRGRAGGCAHCPCVWWDTFHPWQVLMEVAKGLITADDTVTVIWHFFRMAVGGPIIGMIFGEIALYWISHVFNDAMVEISLSIVVAYAYPTALTHAVPISLATLHGFSRFSRLSLISPSRVHDCVRAAGTSRFTYPSSGATLRACSPSSSSASPSLQRAARWSHPKSSTSCTSSGRRWATSPTPSSS